MRFAIIPNIPPNFKRHQRFVENERCCAQGVISSGLTVVDEDEIPDRALILFDNGRVADRVTGLQAVGISPAPSVESMRFYRKKFAQNQAVVAAGITAPITVRVRYGTTFEEVEEALGLPFCTKPDAGYGGCQLRFIRNKDDFEARGGFIAQQVVGRPGVDLSVAIVKGEAVAAYKRTNLDQRAAISLSESYRSNLFPNCEFENYPMTRDLQEIATTVGEVFHNELGTMNLLISRTGDLYFNELNQISPMVSFEEQCNVNPYKEYGLRLMAASRGQG